jgi:hypothetical protein
MISNVSLKMVTDLVVMRAACILPVRASHTYFILNEPTKPQHCLVGTKVLVVFLRSLCHSQPELRLGGNALSGVACAIFVGLRAR